MVETIRETMTALLSRHVVEALFARLEVAYSIKSEDIPDHLDRFLSILEMTFGPSTKVLGKAIAKKFYSRLGLKFTDDPRKTLVDHVEHAKTELARPASDLS